MLNAFLGLPSPSLVTPKSTVLVAPGLHKPQKIVIRYVVVVDRKLLHRHFMRAEFVIPREFIAVNVLHSERGSSGRDLHQMRLHPAGLPSRTLRPAHL